MVNGPFGFFSSMAPQIASYTTKELSKKTWPDFEKLSLNETGGTSAGACIFIDRAPCRKTRD